MLRLVWVSGSEGHREVWNNFDPSRQTWLVSEKSSKEFLERSLLSKNSIISHPVRRASDYWRDILKKVDPLQRVLGPVGTRLSARRYLEENGRSDWCKRPRAPDRLINACNDLGPLITHSEAPEILAQFENEFRASSDQFLEISLLASGFYLDCLSKRHIPHFLLPLILCKTDRSPIRGEDLFFDLGFEFNEGLRELIEFLARENEVTVLVPVSDKKEAENLGLRSYAALGEGSALPLNFTMGISREPFTPELWRCGSPEAEARRAVGQVMAWINQGIEPSRIVIASSSLEAYEDLLSHDLTWEGVPFKRISNSPFSSGRLFRALTARLRLASGETSGLLLKEGFFSLQQKEKRVLKPISSDQQIPLPLLQKNVAELRELKFKDKKRIQAFENVLERICKSFENEGREAVSIFLEQITKGLQGLRQELGDREMDFKAWLTAWIEISKNLSWSHAIPEGEGVWGSDLKACHHLDGEYLIVLGCTEERSRLTESGGLDRRKNAFFEQLGFFLQHREHQNSPLQTQWLLRGGFKGFVLSSPKTNSRGESVAASSLWIKLATEQGKNIDQIDNPRETAWTWLQRKLADVEPWNNIDQLKEWPDGWGNKIKGAVFKEAASETPLHGLALPVDLSLLTLSPSSLETYWKCPFKFYVQKRLRIFDEDDLDLEPSPQLRGQWLHALAEKILKHSKSLDQWTDSELQELVDSLDPIQARLSSEIWPHIRNKLVRLVRRFIVFELEWRNSHPGIRPTYLEEGVAGFLQWGPDSPKIKFELSEGDLPFHAKFKGRLDRVDVLEPDSALIVDYKSGVAPAGAIETWSREGHFQLALYTRALEASFLQGRALNVIAAQFFELKNIKREKGFSGLDLQERENHFSKIEKEVYDCLEGIRKGQMETKPRTVKECDRCQWRTLCRAPHLN